MDIFFIIIGILLIAVGSTLILIKCADDPIRLGFAALDIILVFMGSIWIGLMIQDMYYKDKPSAMDVYQGKTTLEITYRDSIPVDSVVIFKVK